MTNPILPAPLVISRRRYWRRGDVRKFLAEVAGEPTPEAKPDDEHLVGSNELRAWLGGVSDMFLWRHSRRESAPQRAQGAA